MDSQRITDRIGELIEAEYGDTDLFLVDIELNGELIRVLVDADEGLAISRCEAISRQLEFHLEHEGLVPDRYTLEVSSPGLDRPLLIPRQFAKNKGRKVRVRKADGSVIVGRLVERTEEHLTLEEVEPVGKKSKSNDALSLPLEEILETKVMVSFK